MKQFWTACLLAFVGVACDTKNTDLSKFEAYEGPAIEAYNIETLYSDSAKLKIIIRAPKQLQYNNENTEYPEGVAIDFYDEKQEKSARLTANSGKFDKATNVYTATGNVFVEDLKQSKNLKSEELHWSPMEKRIYTDKIVIITTPSEIIKGEGLTAAQDFSEYTILKPIATISKLEE